MNVRDVKGGKMTEEELREKITWILLEWNAWSCEDRARYKFDYADQIITLIKEAGWKSPEEVMDACAEAYQEGLDY